MLTRSAMALAVALLLAPVALGAAALPVNMLVNPGFDQYAVASLPPLARPVLDRCVGVGHQAFDVVFSPWGDWVVATANAGASDPVALVDAATGPTFVGDATGFPLAHAPETLRPGYAAGCPNFNDLAQANAWTMSEDRGLGWSNDPGTRFYDFDGDNDVEAVIPAVAAQHEHNLWQSFVSPQQAMSADFGHFEFTVEAGVIPTRANNQIGLSLSPGFAQHPFVGAFWEGAVMFRANDMAPDVDGRVRLDPARQGEIVCPAGYAPCLDFRAAFDAADTDGRRALLSQARVVQVSFWSFSGGAGPVVLDDVAFVDQKTTAEGIAGSL